MTGPEHYLKAEQLVELASTTSGVDDGEDSLFVAMAQVHATLALAAASAQQLVDRYVGDGAHINDWAKAVAG